MKTRYLAIAAVALASGAGLWIYRRADASEAPAYRFATVERGTVQSTVTATGTLDAVTTVQVGTQVSGQISAIFVDFNDKVKKGQLLARIDPTLQSQAVQDAQAGLERAQAQYAAAKGDYDRNTQLFDARVVTASEFATAQSSYSVAQANVKSAQIALDRVRQNLAYTNIHAPIDGVVIERNVDVGQTVAASLQAPQLFLIANDLSQMQILASVDESDIGKIKDGQSVTFTVQSYADRSFTGTVRQVRLQSAAVNNVVSYTAVIGVPNADGTLLPGMTATVKFVTGTADDALTVPNAALRFTPSGQAATQALAQADSARRARGATSNGSAPAPRAPRPGPARTFGTLWSVDASGKLVATRVRAGLTDGQRTQVMGPNVTDGMKVIVGAGQGTTATGASGAAASPFQSQQTQRRGPPSAF